MSGICTPWAGVDVFVKGGKSGGRRECSSSVCEYAEIGDG